MNDYYTVKPAVEHASGNKGELPVVLPEGFSC